MGSPSAPPAPDYAAANREGIETDIATLPQRLMAELAAKQGKTLYKTADGRYTTTQEDGATAVADFTGLGESERDKQSALSQLELMQGGADIARKLESGRLEDLMKLLPQYNALNLDQQKAAYTAEIEAQKAGTKSILDQQLEYQPAFTKSNLDAEKAAFEQNLDLSDTGTRRQADLRTELLPQVNKAGLDAQSQASDASLANWQKNDPTAAASRDTLGTQLLEELKSGADLSPEQMRRVTQNVRGSQAARGNILGDGAAVDEAIAATGYGDQVKQQRTQNVLNFLGIPQNQLPQYQAAQDINPVNPGSVAGNFQTAQAPNFAATTAGGPNLSPVNINTNPWALTNPNAGAAGNASAQNVWNTQTQFAQNAKSPWAEMLGTGLGVAGAALI